MKNTLFTKITKVFLAVLLLFNCVITPATVRGEDSQTVSAITSLSELGNGDKIAIVNKANQKVLSQTYTGNYNAGVDVTITDDTISYPAATEIWTLGITAEGYYQFMTASGSKLSMDTQYASTPLDKVHDTWKVEAVPDAAGLFYITSADRKTVWNGMQIKMTGAHSPIILTQHSSSSRSIWLKRLRNRDRRSWQSLWY